MCCDTTLLLRHKNESLSQFWISLENEYLFLSLNAIKMLVIFSRTYARNLFQHRLSETSLQPYLSRTLTRIQQKM